MSFRRDRAKGRVQQSLCHFVVAKATSDEARGVLQKQEGERERERERAVVSHLSLNRDVVDLPLSIVLHPLSHRNEVARVFSLHFSLSLFSFTTLAETRSLSCKNSL